MSITHSTILPVGPKQSAKKSILALSHLPGNQNLISDVSCKGTLKQTAGWSRHWVWYSGERLGLGPHSQLQRGTEVTVEALQAGMLTEGSKMGRQRLRSEVSCQQQEH